ncbi:MAG: thioesterase family protein [Rikenellaceae bacterium]
MFSVDYKTRVWYVHTDQMGFVHHSNYICYYEAARSEFLRHFSLSYAEVERRGIMMPILDIQSKYHSPAYYDDELTIRVSLKETPKARITFYYHVYNQDGKLLNEGSTTLGFIHSHNHRPTRCPDWLLEIFESI